MTTLLTGNCPAHRSNASRLRTRRSTTAPCTSSTQTAMTSFARSMPTVVSFSTTSPPVQIEDSEPQSWHSMPCDLNVASGWGSPLHLKNSLRLGQCGFAGGHKPSPERVAFNSGHSMRSNFAAVPAPLRQTSFSTVSARTSPSRTPPKSRSVVSRWPTWSWSGAARHLASDSVCAMTEKWQAARQVARQDPSSGASR